jgi:hypothetical protein
MLAGCGASLLEDRDASAGDVVLVRDAGADVRAGDAAAGGACTEPGTGEVRVMLDVAPGAEVDRTQIWVAAVCLLPDGDGGMRERAVRVVRAEASGGATVLAGLGAGRYVVRASARLWPSAESAQIVVRSNSLVLTHLPLSGGGRPIVVARSAAVDAGTIAPDGGVADASAVDAAGADAASPGVRLEAPIYRPGSSTPVGALEATLQPRDEATFDALVRVRGNDCGSVGGCARIVVSGAELRVTRGGEPHGFAIATFVGSTGAGGDTVVPPGETIFAPSQTLAGDLRGAQVGVSVLLFGAVSDADAGVTQRMRLDAGF